MPNWSETTKYIFKPIPRRKLETVNIIYCVDLCWARNMPRGIICNIVRTKVMAIKFRYTALLADPMSSFEIGAEKGKKNTINKSPVPLSQNKADEIIVLLSSRLSALK
jgi:hypothetical protein